MSKLLGFFVSILFAFKFSSGILYPKDSESRQTKLLNGIWDFRTSPINDQEIGFRDKWFEKPLRKSGPVIPMPVPSSYNDITQDRNIRDFIGWAWYEKEFFVPDTWRANRVVLRFGSVQYYAQVYFNGLLATKHVGGHLPFEVAIQELKMIPGSLNRITVAVNNTLTPDTIPQGSIKYFNESDNYPANFYEFSVNFDFFNYAGIHRSVILYSTPTFYVDDINIVTEIADDIGIVNFEVKYEGTGQFKNLMERLSMTAECVVIIFDKENELVASSKSCEGRIEIAGVHLWWPFATNPDPGYLYTMKIELHSFGGTDVYYQKFGIRTVNITETEFLINGQPFYFTGFGKHEDASIRGRGLDWPLIVKDFNLIKWIGANSFRTSHYPYSEELMDMADEQGIVVIDECPAVGLNKFDKDLLSLHMEMMNELVKRDKNRPSVVIWSVANEPKSANLKSEKYFKTIVAHTKALDKTRPVSAALNVRHTVDKVGQYLDLIMRNRYYSWYQDSGHPQVIVPRLMDELIETYMTYNKPILMSEYGADAISGFHESPSVMFTEDYQSEVIIETHRAFDELRKEGFLIGEMIWNFADFMTMQTTTRAFGNRKGIFTRERQPKAAAKILRCRYHKLANMSLPDTEVYCPRY